MAMAAGGAGGRAEDAESLSAADVLALFAVFDGEGDDGSAALDARSRDDGGGNWSRSLDAADDDNDALLLLLADVDEREDARVSPTTNGDRATATIAAAAPEAPPRVAAATRRPYAVLKPAPSSVAGAHTSKRATPSIALLAAVRSGALECAEPQPRAAAAPLTQTPAPKTRKRVKDEIESLRVSVASLEAQLRRLRYADNSGTATGCRDVEPPTRTPGAVSALESFALSLITAQSPEPSVSTLQLWKRVAVHQLDARKRAEAENARLRSLLRAQTKLAQSLQRSFSRCPSVLDLRPPEPKLKLTNRSLVADPSAEAAQVYARLAERLESLYKRVDAALAETGLGGNCGEFTATQVRTDPATGRTFVDLTSAFVLPFEIGRTSSAFWLFFNRPSGDLRDGVFQDAGPLPSVDPASGKIRAKFALNMPLRFGDVAFSGHILGKRFVEDSRIVFAWCTVGTFESAAIGVGPMPMRESGWSVLERVPNAASPATAATLVRSVFRIHPQTELSREGALEDRVARALSDAVAEAFLEDATLLIRAAESIIMRVQ